MLDGCIVCEVSYKFVELGSNLSTKRMLPVNFNLSKIIIKAICDLFREFIVHELWYKKEAFFGYPVSYETLIFFNVVFDFGASLPLNEI